MKKWAPWLVLAFAVFMVATHPSNAALFIRLLTGHG